jgi:hypothetical protein
VLAQVKEYEGIAEYNNSLARYEWAKGTIMQHDNVNIAEGDLPICAQVRAVEHERERSKALEVCLRPDPLHHPGMVSGDIHDLPNEHDLTQRVTEDDVKKYEEKLKARADQQNAPLVVQPEKIGPPPPLPTFEDKGPELSPILPPPSEGLETDSAWRRSDVPAAPAAPATELRPARATPASVPAVPLRDSTSIMEMNPRPRSAVPVNSPPVALPPSLLQMERGDFAIVPPPAAAPTGSPASVPGSMPGSLPGVR